MLPLNIVSSSRLIPEFSSHSVWREDGNSQTGKGTDGLNRSNKAVEDCLFHTARTFLQNHETGIKQCWSGVLQNRAFLKSFQPPLGTMLIICFEDIK